MLVKNLPDYVVLGGLAALAFVAWRAYQATQAGTSANVGHAIGGALVDGANGAVQGVVEGVGGMFGLPATNASKCAACIAAKDFWGASAACPASDFIGAVASGAFFDRSAPGLPSLNDGYDAMGNATGGAIYGDDGYGVTGSW